MAWHDKYLNPIPEELITPLTNGFAITPSNSDDLAEIPRGIYIGVAGDVKMTLRDHESDSNAVTFVNMQIGMYPLRPRKIFLTGTSATNIIGLY